MLDVPASSWRWIVANWPPDAWSSWRSRVDAILATASAAIPPEDRAEAPGPDVEEIRAAELRAFEEMKAEALTAERKAKLFTVTTGPSTFAGHAT